MWAQGRQPTDRLTKTPTKILRLWAASHIKIKHPQIIEQILQRAAFYGFLRIPIFPSIFQFGWSHGAQLACSATRECCRLLSSMSVFVCMRLLLFLKPALSHSVSQLVRDTLGVYFFVARQGTQQCRGQSHSHADYEISESAAPCGNIDSFWTASQSHSHTEHAIFRKERYTRNQKLD